MSCILQETVTGSTLNGRKEYLKADEGDKDKWEFLNFANAWTPRETVLPLEGNAGNVKDDVFFTYVSWQKRVNRNHFEESIVALQLTCYCLMTDLIILLGEAKRIVIFPSAFPCGFYPFSPLYQLMISRRLTDRIPIIKGELRHF